MPSRWLRPVLVSAVLGAVAGFASCRVIFSDDVLYTCKTDADCGGDGYRCAIGPARALCCKPSGPEVCDKKDNDCDGLSDNTGLSETCNGEDDDCNGQVDETFNFANDSNHCGTCDTVCPQTHYCASRRCVERLELVCYDGLDDDNDGKTDCDDPSCDQQTCGAACICSGLKKTEDLCSDRVDNEGDSLTDCLDPDCTGKACARGCTCVADGGVSETNCMDGVDNDVDSRADCLDADCVGELCTPPEIYFRCTASEQCKCNGGVQVAEVGSVLCRDEVDNDCDGPLDCGEASCDTVSCQADGGLDCVCSALKKKEANCANLADDDGDGQADCADADCAQGTSCTRPGGGAGVCSATKTCE